MSTVSIPSPDPRGSARRRTYAAAVARRLRSLMRDHGINPFTLAWILDCSLLRALRLSLGSTSWTCTEAFRLVHIAAPSTPVSSVFAEQAGA